MHELHTLIAEFGVVYRVGNEALARIKAAAMKQSPASIANSINYFKQALK